MPRFPDSQIEPGSLTRIFSLIGVPGRQNHGRQVTIVSGTLAATGSTSFNINPLRVAALIQNTGSNSMLLSFGGTNTTGITIAAGGAVQIDSLFPWCGGIGIYSTAGTTYTFSEISIQD